MTYLAMTLKQNIRTNLSNNSKFFVNNLLITVGYVSPLSKVSFTIQKILPMLSTKPGMTSLQSISVGDSRTNGSCPEACTSSNDDR